ncbi:serine/threonine protein kinase [Micromonospora pisi]|uniref:non-specific serine/threonine protein kinase n=1 Tax=Micromonospora pisi TaxID=589240 RepID=A0A495JSW6_9ACTN|nr:serine/threonine protein kinase [Micromonospora pisi]
MGEILPRHITDRYVLVERIGQGGMGRVWRARDEMLQRDVAVKEIVAPPGLTDESRQELRERSLREARAIARLDHPNVVRVFDVLTSDGEPWIVMEYVPSRSLHEMITTDGPLLPVRAAEIGLGLLGALRAAHRAGIMHRDVKPANVLLGLGGRIVLTDFGLATAVEDTSLTLSGVVLGSPAYVSPERAMSGIVGPEGDLWSLGTTLYAAVEGRSPYARPSSLMSLTALVTEPPPVAEHAGPLAPVLEGLLRKDPASRIDIATAERMLRRIVDEPLDHRPEVGRGETEHDRTRPRPAVSFTEPTDAMTIVPTDATNIVPVTTDSLGAGAYPENAPSSRPRRPRRGLLLGTLAALLLVGAAVAVPMAGRGRPNSGGSDSALSSGEPAGPQSPVMTPAADTTASSLTWTVHTDSTGFSLPVPQEWQIRRAGSRVEFREPDGERLLAVSQTESPKPDPLAELTAREKTRPTGGQYRNYRRVALVGVTYHLAAADWEWSYTSEVGEPAHVRQRTFVTAKQRGYTIAWSTPESLWASNERDFQRITAGFRPAPAPGTTPQTRPSRSATPSAIPDLPGDQITGRASGRCLDVANPDSPDPVRLRIWDCGASRTRNQSWTFAPDGSIRLLDRCMDVLAASSDDGAAIQLTTCNTTPAQRFTFNADQQLVNASSGKCLDVVATGTSNGALVEQSTCDTSVPSQRWSRS